VTAFSRSGQYQPGPMDYERVCDFRFRDLDQPARGAVWAAAADNLFVPMGKPQIVLDPRYGQGECISAVPAGKRWAIDLIPSVADRRATSLRLLMLYPLSKRLTRLSCATRGRFAYWGISSS